MARTPPTPPRWPTRRRTLIILTSNVLKCFPCAGSFLTIPRTPRVLFFLTTLPIKPATIALKIGHLALPGTRRIQGSCRCSFFHVFLSWLCLASTEWTSYKSSEGFGGPAYHIHATSRLLGWLTFPEKHSHFVLFLVIRLARCDGVVLGSFLKESKGDLAYSASKCGAVCTMNETFS